MQKVSFTCENCDVTGTVRLPSDYDESHRVEMCPCCGSHLDIEDDDSDD